VYLPLQWCRYTTTDTKVAILSDNPVFIGENQGYGMPFAEVTSPELKNAYLGIQNGL
jgi:hypothetical protein